MTPVLLEVSEEECLRAPARFRFQSGNGEARWAIVHPALWTDDERTAFEAAAKAKPQ